MSRSRRRAAGLLAVALWCCATTVAAAPQASPSHTVALPDTPAPTPAPLVAGVSPDAALQRLTGFDAAAVTVPLSAAVSLLSTIVLPAAATQHVVARNLALAAECRTFAWVAVSDDAPVELAVAFAGAAWPLPPSLPGDATAADQRIAVRIGGAATVTVALVLVAFVAVHCLTPAKHRRFFVQAAQAIPRLRHPQRWLVALLAALLGYFGPSATAAAVTALAHGGPHALPAVAGAIAVMQVTLLVLVAWRPLNTFDDALLEDPRRESAVVEKRRRQARREAAAAEEAAMEAGSDLPMSATQSGREGGTGAAAVTVVRPAAHQPQVPGDDKVRSWLGRRDGGAVHALPMSSDDDEAAPRPHGRHGVRAAAVQRRLALLWDFSARPHRKHSRGAFFVAVAVAHGIAAVSAAQPGTRDACAVTAIAGTLLQCLHTMFLLRGHVYASTAESSLSTAGAVCCTLVGAAAAVVLLTDAAVSEAVLALGALQLVTTALFVLQLFVLLGAAVVEEARIGCSNVGAEEDNAQRESAPAAPRDGRPWWQRVFAPAEVAVSTAPPSACSDDACSSPGTPLLTTAPLVAADAPRPITQQRKPTAAKMPPAPPLPTSGPSLWRRADSLFDRLREAQPPLPATHPLALRCAAIMRFTEPLRARRLDRHGPQAEAAWQELWAAQWEAVHCLPNQLPAEPKGWR